MIQITDLGSISVLLDNLDPAIPSPTNLQKLGHIHSSHTAYLHMWLLHCQKKINLPTFIICPNDESASLLFKSLVELYPQTLFFPFGRKIGDEKKSGLSWFDHTRVQSLYSLARQYKNVATKSPLDTAPIVICSVASWSLCTMSKVEASSRGLSIAVGDEINTESLAQQLIEGGYTRVTRVQQDLEFAMRGEVIDIYTGFSQSGIRIHTDFGEAESIHEFSLKTQLSNDIQHQSIEISFAREYTWDVAAISKLKTNIVQHFSEVSSQCLSSTINTLKKEGFHPYEHLFGMYSSAQTSHISEYVPESLVFYYQHEECIKASAQLENEYQKLFSSIHSEIVCPRYSKMQYLREQIIQANTISSISLRQFVKESSTDFSVGDQYSRSFRGNIQLFAKYCAQYLLDGYKVVIFYAHFRNFKRLKTLVFSLLTQECEALGLENAVLHFVQSTMPLGFLHDKEKLVCFTESELLGKSLRFIESQYTGEQANGITEPSNGLISDLEQLEEGDLLVHINYGIGRFVRLERKEFFDVEKDYIKINYDNNESLYVPIEQMSLVHRYIGKDPQTVVLDSLGSPSWGKRKAKAKATIEDISEELLETQAKRNAISGISFKGSEQLEEDFINDFEYTDTPDQYKAWLDIKRDMELIRPMDRLVVGDVGFGKTELAFRSAFKAICAHKQVLFLAPTTILVEQHFERATERYKKWPLVIDMLTRFRTTAESKLVSQKTNDGSLDLLIATHKALRSNTQFKNIGLVVIDEEHRFGVKDKELLKKRYPFVDILSMSATPIPRTLQQSIFSIRQLSVIKTPPQARRPIITHVERFSPKLIKTAIEKEIARGGQVFFLHNRINSLQEIKEFIEELVEEATIVVLNGQMQATQIEDGMRRFVHGGANVLVSTTIIENGIDIPNVNTIIIDKANNYGISQLYQLRGRVGRSDRSAHAFLLYQNELTLSSLAVKRLTTISEQTELGAGFEVARADLEVRGAGNLLGKEQSGNMQSVGYQYYLQLLDRAVKEKKGQTQALDSVLLDLEYSGYIPESYIPDAGSRMSLYKKIASIDSTSSLQTVENELKDMFGNIPLEIRNLMYLSHIRVLARKLHIESIKKNSATLNAGLAKNRGGLEIAFSNVSLLDHKRAAELMASNKIQPGSQANTVFVPKQVFTGFNSKSNSDSDHSEKGYELKLIYEKLSELLEYLLHE